MASGKAMVPEVASLVFYTALNGGWNFNILRNLPDGGLENYGDAISGWYDDPEGYDAAFAIFENELEDEEVAEKINGQFLSILTEEVEKQVGRNFGFPAGTQVACVVQD